MNQYICKSCLNNIGVDVDKLNAVDYNKIASEHSFSTDSNACPKCGDKNIIRIFSVLTTYVRGYGLIDKDGMKRDSDMHAMMHGNDPYASIRPPGESKEVIRRLQKAREHNPRPKKVGL